MKRKKAKTKAPQIRLVGWDAPVRAAVMVAGLASGTAMAAPGDLDPSFGDVGRKSGITYSWFESLRSVEVQDDDSVIFGGGGEYAYYESYEDFFGRLLPDGTPDSGFVLATLDKVALYDTALQSDGKLVGVGLVRQPDNRQKPALAAGRLAGSARCLWAWQVPSDATADRTEARLKPKIRGWILRPRPRRHRRTIAAANRRHHPPL